MGLNFRKSVKILPGVKLNFSKSGVSISAGVPGFRKSISTTGRVTTTYSIPGTGIYYKDTKNIKNKKKTTTSSKSSTTKTTKKTDTVSSGRLTKAGETSYIDTDNVLVDSKELVNDFDYADYETFDENVSVEQLDMDSIKAIYKTADDSIDWEEMASSETPLYEGVDEELWKYYHDMSSFILNGNIDSYLQLIYDVNPLGDLLAYGSNFQFDCDDPKKIEVKFNMNESALTNVKQSVSSEEYKSILEDYVCAVAIRTARDMFALLPVENCVVYVELNLKTVLTVNFDRETMSKVKFGFIDPSDTMSRFQSFLNVK